MNLNANYASKTKDAKGLKIFAKFAQFVPFALKTLRLLHNIMYFDCIRFDYAHIAPASFGNAMLSVNKDGHLAQDVRLFWISSIQF